MSNQEGELYQRQGEFKSPEQQARSSRQADVLARLEQAVGAIQDSESFRRFLDMQARFHHYSFGNVALILSQRPDATQVAGYNAWLKLHRYVRRGEHGIRIIVPMRKKAAEPDGDEPSRIFFGSGTVFDLDQTDGEPLPEVTVPDLVSDEGGQLYGHLYGLAAREGLTVHEGEIGLPAGAAGVYRPKDRVIIVRPAAALQMTTTLAHELGHHFSGLHGTRGDEESIAESVAYVVCRRFGLDCGEASFPYVAIWAREPSVLRRVLGVVQGVSARIIDGIEGSEESNGGGLPDDASQG
jgi:hypothetical protein